MRSRERRVATTTLAAILAWTSAFAAPSSPSSEDLVDETKDDPRVLEARSLIRLDKHVRAAELLQATVEEEDAGRIPVDVGNGRFVSLRSRALRLLATLPPEGLRAYRAIVDPTARRLLAAARDEAALERVASLYLCSSVGAEALDRLGNRRLDRGDLPGALAAWRRLLEDAPAGRRPDRGVVAAKAAAVASLLGRSDLVDRMTGLAGDARPSGGSRIEISEIDLPVRRALEAADREEPGPLRWLGFAPVRTDVPGAGTGPWPVRYRPANVLPAAGAILAGGKILTRDGNHVVALDPYDPGKEPVRFAVPDRRNRPRNGRAMFIQQVWYAQAMLRHPSWVDVTSGAVAAGEGIAIVSDRGVAPVIHAGGGAVRMMVAGQDTNRLVAYDLATGRSRWTRGETDDPLHGCRFAAVPEIVDGRAYVPYVHGQVHHVAALDLAGGETLWATPIGPTTLDAAGSLVRSDGSPVAVDEDAVHVVTNSGRAACLDRRTGDLRWIRSLPRAVRKVPRTPPWVPYDPDLPVPAAPVVSQGRVVLLASDSKSLVCLDAWTGETLWETEVAPASNHLIGVSAGRVLVGGRSLRVYDLDSTPGSVSPIWGRAIPDPSGRACVVGEHVYVPSGHRILRFPLADGGAGEIVVEADVRVGNLVPRPNGFLGVGVEGVSVFLDVAAENRRLASDEGGRAAFLAALRAFTERGEEDAAAAEAEVGADLLLRRAQRKLRRDPAISHDLARLIERRYPGTPAAAAAGVVLRAALEARGLRRDGPAGEVKIGFPLAHAKTYRGNHPALVRMRPPGATGAGDRAWFYLVRQPSHLEEGEAPGALHCVGPDGDLRWSGLAEPQETQNRSRGSWVMRSSVLLDRGCVGAVEDDRLAVVTSRAFYWLDVDSGEVERRLETGPGRDGLARQAMQANFLWLSRQAIQDDLRISDHPCRLVARGVAVVAHAGKVRGFGAKGATWSHEETGRIIGDLQAWEDRFVVTRLGPTRVVIRRLDTGVPAAEIRFPGTHPAGPARIAGDTIVIATEAHRLTGHDAWNGSRRWSVRLPDRPRRIVHADERRVVVLLANGRLEARRPADGEPLWTVSALEEGETLLDARAEGSKLAVWAGSNVRVAGLRGYDVIRRVHGSSYLRVFDLDTGDRPWDQRTIQAGPPYRTGPMVLTSGHALLPVSTDRQIIVQAIRLRDGELEDPVRIEGQTNGWTPEVGIAPGLVLVTTPRGVAVHRATPEDREEEEER